MKLTLKGFILAASGDCFSYVERHASWHSSYTWFSCYASISSMLQWTNMTLPAAKCLDQDSAFRSSSRLLAARKKMSGADPSKEKCRSQPSMPLLMLKLKTGVCAINLWPHAGSYSQHSVLHMTVQILFPFHKGLLVKMNHKCHHLSNSNLVSNC